MSWLQVRWCSSERRGENIDNVTGEVQPLARRRRRSIAGKKTLKASGSTAQANAMTRFVNVFEQACSGQTLNHGQWFGRWNQRI